jgi:hypothetical protein
MLPCRADDRILLEIFTEKAAAEAAKVEAAAALAELQRAPTAALEDAQRMLVMAEQQAKQMTVAAHAEAVGIVAGARAEAKRIRG